ncbi:STAS domain-containing protein [Rhizobium terrae]|uniref:STAS domain-containing protein n=1 Tax=Rhizobium terrae TaxID=2171756 RepID=UPI0013C2BD11|nr:STAS domain-containing protein [Rhizobium terrae]
MFAIAETTERGATIIAPTGKIDTLTAKAFEAEMKKRIDGETGALLVDMSAVDYVSSFGLRSLLIAAKQLAPAGRKYILFGLNPQVHEVLRVSGFLKIISVVATRAQALDLVGPPPVDIG